MDSDGLPSRQDSAISCSAGEAAVMHSECPICLEDLCDMDHAPVCVLVGGNGRRSCRHFYHQKCAEELQSMAGDANCPLCRVSFTAAVELPDPFKDLDRWFSIVDLSGEGSLTKVELVDVVSATLAVDQGRIPDLVEKHWHSWDVNGSNTIGPEELGNLLPFLKKYLPVRKRANPPFLPEDPSAWFDYWDEDNDGSLSAGEVTRAVAKTLGAKFEKACELVEGLWCLFDFSGSNSVTRAEFSAKRGLSEMLCAALAQDDRLKPRVHRALRESLPDIGSELQLEPVEHEQPALPAVQAPSAANEEVDIRLGDRVQSLYTGDQGVVTAISGDNITVDFPEIRNWLGTRNELFVLSTTVGIQVDSSVRIARDVSMPRYGWGLIQRGSIGKVLGIQGYRVRVSFPEQPSWHGVLGELELVMTVSCPVCGVLNDLIQPECFACRMPF